jgi:hypothetical protein
MGWSRNLRGPFLAVLFALSAISTAIGMRAITRFDETPGKAGPAPERWPSSSSLDHSPTGPELVVFVHPLCSCTIATLHELSLLPIKPRTAILFYRPSTTTKWRAGKIWAMAEQLPGARVLWDDGGKEAARFGAATSGYMLLYDAGGQLLFRGGVTVSRGHEGDNEGFDSLVAALRSGARARAPSRVYGCGISGRGNLRD